MHKDKRQTVHMSFRISPKLKKAFKIKAMQEEKKVQEILSELISSYVKKGENNE